VESFFIAMPNKIVIFLLLCTLSTACQRQPKMYRYEKLVMGMHLSLKVPFKNGVSECVDKVFKEVDEHYNNWNPNSEISRFNAYEGTAPYYVSEKLWTLLKHTQDLIDLTEGRFDPTVAPLVQAWKQALNEGRLLSLEEKYQAHKVCGWDLVELSDQTIQKKKSGLKIDLCGVAKGYAVDRLANELKQLGCAWAYVEWGGEIRTLGCHPQGRKWHVSIEGLKVLNVENQAIATSGGSWQSWNVGGKSYTHIIHPQTGWPLLLADNSPYTCAVQAHSCVEADAIATALMCFDTVEEASLWAQSHLNNQTVYLINQKEWKLAHSR
jgi:FAD:protein FMN transferase